MCGSRDVCCHTANSVSYQYPEVKLCKNINYLFLTVCHEVSIINPIINIESRGTEKRWGEILCGAPSRGTTTCSLRGEVPKMVLNHLHTLPILGCSGCCRVLRDCNVACPVAAALPGFATRSVLWGPLSVSDSL